mmetsp:Transcript_14296/g.47421  ORF Transcript_14296/g.47421 Transcript_14296/m.47421 type:complete len:243 (-) Transcript_14296:335-1063(-)
MATFVTSTPSVPATRRGVADAVADNKALEWTRGIPALLFPAIDDLRLSLPSSRRREDTEIVSSRPEVPTESVGANAPPPSKRATRPHTNKSFGSAIGELRLFAALTSSSSFFVDKVRLNTFAALFTAIAVVTPIAGASFFDSSFVNANSFVASNPVRHTCIVPGSSNTRFKDWCFCFASRYSTERHTSGGCVSVVLAFFAKISVVLPATTSTIDSTATHLTFAFLETHSNRPSSLESWKCAT